MIERHRKTQRSIRKYALAIAFATCTVSGCTDPDGTALQGYTEGEYVRVAAPFAGQLAQLTVKRGQQVRAGDPLFALEQASEAAARREAADRVARAEAQLANLKLAKRPSEIDAVRAQLAQAEAALRLAEANLKRQEELARAKFVTRERLDDAQTQLARDRGRVEELQAQLTTAQLAARPDEIRAAAAELAAARAELAQADWRLQQKAQRAPQSALVQETLYVEGEWVPAGAPVVSLLSPGHVKVRFFVAEARLGAVRVGQSISVTCDGCAGPITARIDYIAPQAEFTPPVIYSRENRAKLVFLVEARPAPDDAVKLHPGQPVEVVLQ